MTPLPGAAGPSPLQVDGEAQELLASDFMNAAGHVGQALDGLVAIANSPKPLVPPQSQGIVVGLCGQGGRHTYFEIPEPALRSALLQIAQQATPDPYDRLDGTRSPIASTGSQRPKAAPGSLWTRRNCSAPRMRSGGASGAVRYAPERPGYVAELARVRDQLDPDTFEAAWAKDNASSASLAAVPGVSATPGRAD